MALARLKDWAYPAEIKDVKDVDTYLRHHYEQHVEESQSRVEDFEDLEIDTLTVSEWTIQTSFKPSADATVDLGAVGATDYRFRHLYLSGNLSDETNTLTVANAKSAYDHISANGSSHSYIDQSVVSGANVTFGTIGSNEITVADGHGINLQEDITFTGATTENLIKMPDDLLDALSIQEGSNKYVTFDTVDDEEDIFFYKSVDILHTATHANDHALEIDTDAAMLGDVKALDIDYITGQIDKGQDEGIILINIDETAADGGEVFGLEVLSTDGSASIHGIKVGPVVHPVHQDSGVFIDPTLATNDTPTTHVGNMVDHNLATTTDIFKLEDDYIIIGANDAFQDMELVFTTVSSKDIRPTFEYSTSGIDQFTEFTPVDGTDGCRHTGVISWDASDLSGHVADNTTGKFDIKITRTKAGSMTTPVLGYAKTAKTVEYVWDKNGDISIRNLTAVDTLFKGPIVDARAHGMATGASAANNRTYLQAAIDGAPAGGTVLVPRDSGAYSLDNSTSINITHALTLIIEGEIDFTDDSINLNVFNITGDDVSIIGQGGKIKGPGTFPYQYNVVIDVTGERFTCRDLTIEDPVQCGIFIDGSGNHIIDGLRVVGGKTTSPGSGNFGIEIENSGTDGILISNCSFVPNASSGVVVQGIASDSNPTHLTITGCFFDSMHDHAVYIFGNYHTVTGNTAKSTTNSAWKIIGGFLTVTGNTSDKDFDVANCHDSVISSNIATGIDVYEYGTYTGNYDNVIIANNKLEGGGLGIRFNISDRTAYNVQIINNILQNVDTAGGYNGIWVYSDSTNNIDRIKIDGNILDTIGDGGIVCSYITDGSISNNIIRDPAQQTANKRGIELTIGCDNVLISNNQIIKETGANAMDYGIMVVAAASNANCMIEDNKIAGAGTEHTSAATDEGHGFRHTGINTFSVGRLVPNTGETLEIGGNIACGFSDTGKISLYNTAVAEAAFFQLATTKLIIDADSDIEIKPANTLAATFKADGSLALGEIWMLDDQVWDNSDNEGGAIQINAVGKDGGTTQFKNFGIFNGKGGQIAKFEGSDKGVHLPGLKTGTTQGGAGATEGELWVDADDDNTIKLGAST